MLLDSTRDAFNQMRANKYTTLTTIGIISIILLVFGIFLLSIYNISIFAEILKSEMEVVVYLEDQISSERLEKIKNEITGFEEVEKIVYISKDEALDVFARDMANIYGVVRELKHNPLPDAFRISLVGNARTPDSINALAEKLKVINGVEDVEYGKEWVERLNALLSTLKVAGAVLGGIIFLIVLFIVSNTIKLAFLTRRDELKIMRHSGTKNLFIKIPYIIEGGFLGLIGAISSIIMLLFTYKLIVYKIPPAAYLWLGGVEFSFIPWKGIIFIIITGIIVGCFGGWTSVGRYIGVAIFLILCLNINNVDVGEAKDIQGIERGIEDSQKQLHDVDKQIKEKKRVTKKIAAEEKKTLNRIVVKEKDLSNKKKDLKKVYRDIIQKEREIKGAQGNIDVLTVDITERKNKMTDFLRYVYKSYIGRPRGSAEILLLSSDYNDFMIRLKYQDRLIGEANRLIKDLGKDMDVLQGQLLSLNRRHRSLKVDKDNLVSNRVTLERDIKQNRQQLASIQKRKAGYEEELKRLNTASAALKKLIISYEKERSQLASIGYGFGKEKGQLIWPLDGNVVSTFGRQKHPEFDEYIYKKGIEIASNGIREIKAVYEGVVAYADWLKGYGLIVIIDHGNSYYSIYAHASKLLISKGARVKRGQVVAIAGVGNANASDREGIYFEIRHKGEAVDPLAWLERG